MNFKIESLVKFPEFLASLSLLAHNFFVTPVLLILLWFLLSLYRIMPQMVAGILSDSYRRERVLSQSDASDVLREAFSQTEASIDHHYEVFT